MTDSAATVRRPIVVMKFGGTSVADETGRAALARRVTSALELGKAPLLVVSAMGRSGAPYATDTLLGLVAELPVSERELDLLASVGELVSAVVVAAELRAAGVAAEAFSAAEAGIFTDGVPGNAAITEIYPARILAAIDAGMRPGRGGFPGSRRGRHAHDARPRRAPTRAPVLSGWPWAPTRSRYTPTSMAS